MRTNNLKRHYLLRVVLVVVSCLVAGLGRAQTVDSLLQAYDSANKKEKVAIANKVVNWYGEAVDTLYKFDTSSDEGWMDYLVQYFGAEWANEKNKYTLAQEHIQRAIALCKKYGSESEMSDCYSLACIIYQRTGDFTNALEYAEECLDLDRKLDIKENLSSSLNAIAAIYLALDRPNEAVKYIEEAITIERTLERPDRLAVRLGMASDIYVKKGEAGSALLLAQEAYDIEKSLGNKSKIAVRQSQLAAVYIELDMQADAEQILMEAKAQFEADGNENSLAITLNQLASLCIKRENFSQAAVYALRSEAICRQTGNRYLEKKAVELCWKSLRRSDPAMALTKLERYSQLTDSIFSEQTAQRLSQFNVKYEMSEKQHQIELQQQQITNHRLWIVLLIALFIAALAGLGVMWRMTMQKEKANKMLVRTNLVKDHLIALAKEEKEKEQKEKAKKISDMAEEIGQLGDMPDIHLTKREKQVIVLLCQGKLAKEVADDMNISVRTVDTHKTNIYRKLGVNNTVELMRYAQQMGVME